MCACSRQSSRRMGLPSPRRHAVTPESVACPFVLPLLSATEPLCMDMHGHGDCQHGQIEIYWAPRPRMRTRICRLSPLPGLGGGCYAERLRNEEMVSCLTKLGECARSYSGPCSFSLLRYSEGHAHYARTVCMKPTHTKAHKCQIGKRPSSAWRPLWRAMLVLAVLTVPDERGLCQNRAQSRDPHHMGDTGCYFSGPVVLPHLTITP